MYLDPEGLGKTGQFIGSGIIRNRAAGGGDVFRSGLGARLRPLGADILCCELAEIDLVHAAEYGLRVFLADLGDGDAADFYRVLKNRRLENRELIDVGPLQEM